MSKKKQLKIKKRKNENHKRGEYTKARKKAYLKAKNAFVYSINKQERSEVPINNTILNEDNTMTNTLYSYKKTLIKTLKPMILIAFGIGINQAYLNYPDMMGLTFGGVLIAMLDFLKHRWGIKI